jgi:hypothetical protein
MTDSAGATPFSGFAGFKSTEMFDRMFEMIRQSPFGGMAFPGAAQGLPPSLSVMSDMMAPFTSVEELDKRITDLRAVEQWLKLNLSMLQSAIQALEVQRATLSTLRAFGAFAQSSMSAAEDVAAAATQVATAPLNAAAAKAAAAKAAAAKDEAEAGAAGGEAPADGDAAAAPFDPAGWWNLLQTQFTQLANFAVTQPGAQAAASDESASAAASEPPAAADKPAAKRAAKPAGSAAERAAAASTPLSRPPKRGA